MRFYIGWLLGVMCLVSVLVVVVLQDDLDCCLVILELQVFKQGISVDGFICFIVGFILDLSVLLFLDVQFEFIMLLWDYFVVLVDIQCVDDGCVCFFLYCDLFVMVLVQYGVDFVIIVVVWGVESDYGCVFGKCLLLQLLVMLFCNGCW